MSESDAAERPRPTFIASLADESDRGFVLVGAARLDNLLEKLLRAKLLTCSHSSKEDLDYLLSELRGPIQPFGIRIRMARALGLISEPARKSLDAIREMRNVCAHEEDWKAEKVVKKAKRWPTLLVACPRADYAGRKTELEKRVEEFTKVARHDKPEQSEARIVVMFIIFYMADMLTKRIAAMELIS